MRKVKKYVSLLCFLLALMFCFNAYAVQISTVDVYKEDVAEAGIKSGDVVIKGTVDSEDAKTILLHLVRPSDQTLSKDDGDSVYSGSTTEIDAGTKLLTTLTSDDEGNFTAEFNMDTLTDDEGLFFVSFSAFGEDNASAGFTNYKKSTIDSYRNQINDILDEVEAGTKTEEAAHSEIKAILQTCSVMLLSVDGDAEVLTTPGYYDLYTTLVMELPQAEDNEEFANNLDTAAAICFLNEGEITAEEMMDTYSENMNLESVDGYAYYKDADNKVKGKLKTKLQEFSDDIDSYEGFKDAFSGAALFTELNETNGTEGKIRVLNSYTQILDLSEFNKSKNDQAKVVKNITNGIESGRITDVEDINEELATFIEKETGGNSSSSSSLSSSGLPLDYNANPVPTTGNSATYVPNNTSFNDLASYEWAIPSIERLAKLGVLNGVSADSFEPARNITRAEFAKILCGCLAIEESTMSIAFADVTEDAWYYGYVSALLQRGIVSGKSEGLFAPNDYITREEMATIVYRASKKLYDTADILSPAYSDYDTVSEFAKEAVSVLSYYGHMNGMPDGSFAPASNATRAEAAKFMDTIENFVAEVEK